MDEKVLRSLSDEQLSALEKEGFDRTDPSGPWVVGFTIAIVVTVVVVVFAVDYLYHSTYQANVYQQQLAPESQDLQEIRQKEAEQLNHYRYIGGDKTKVRLPIERAMELFAAEAKAGKTFYPAKPLPVKTPEQIAAAAAGAKPGAPAAQGAGVGTKQ